MPHPVSTRSTRRSSAPQIVALFASAAVALYCLPPSAPTPAPGTNSLQPAAGAEQPIRDQVQQLLAQGGCPGWIAIAGDPQLLAPASPAVGDVTRVSAVDDRKTGGIDASVGPALLAALPPVDDPEDPDALISEEEDLLHSSPGIAGVSEEPAAKRRGERVNLDAPAASSLDGTIESNSHPDSGPVAPAASDDAIPPAEHNASAEPAKPAITENSEPAPLPEVEPSTDPQPASDHAVDNPLVDDEDDLLESEEDLLREDDSPTPERTSPESLPAAPEQIAPAPAEKSPQPQASPFAPPPLPAPHSTAPKSPSPSANTTASVEPLDEKSRCEFIAKSLYPSAAECRVCHEKIYEEWSVSSHAYAAVSPMFHKFEQKINDITQGTIGYFCYRCHTPVGTSLGLSRATPLWDAPLVAREGVTCIACHRISEMYGKTNGERRIEPGDIHAPVYGSIGGDGVARAVAEKDHFKVKTSPHDKGPGQPIHVAALTNPQLAKSEFCMSCHQVAVYPGIKLEVVWEQYRASPACKKGISCQDCHMGRIPGVPSGYETGPAALINNKSVNDGRKHSNHVFYGPGYSIAHPGVFPFNPKAERWSMRDWLLFDWRAGWGTEAFEDAVDNGLVRVNFPDVWKDADDRMDAREIIEDNLKKKAVKHQLRAQVMENGSHVDGPFFDSPLQAGGELRFHYNVVNTNEGHNLPTASLGAQPQLWANVVLIGPRGNRLWETGYLDSLGDLADIHSEDVRLKRLPYDWQLFNLQTMFLITGAKGTDREFFLPVNIDIDPLPFIRPAPQPVSVINHPPFIRMEARSLAPLGSRKVPYKIPAHLLAEPGRYRLSFRLRSRTEPMYFMRFCDSTVEMQRSMLEGTLDFHQMSVEFELQ